MSAHFTSSIALVQWARAFALAFACVAALCACGSSRGPTTDGGGLDARVDGAPGDVDAGDGGGLDARVDGAPGDVDAGDVDAGDSGAAPVLDSGPPDAGCAPTTELDLLFMIDNSGSMSEEQASLGAELPRLVQILSSGDRTGDGSSADDFEPFASLHLGVITSDMGGLGFSLPSCRARFGDDGLLRMVGNTSIAGCVATYPHFLEYLPGVSAGTPEELGANFGCVAAAGISGCGWEQQLEATLKALTPASSPTTFFDGSRGHGDGANVGFLRPDSVLALVLVTDEEDCSLRAGGEGVLDTASVIYPGDLNLRCFLYKDTQTPITRYIDGFRALRAGHESRLIVGAITGVPEDLIASSGTPDYDAMLGDPRMTEVVDTAGVGARLVPSCNVPGRGTAYPPRRIVEVARAFGENGVVQSICQASFAGALDTIIARVASVSDPRDCAP